MKKHINAKLFSDLTNFANLLLDSVGMLLLGDHELFYHFPVLEKKYNMFIR